MADMEQHIRGELFQVKIKFTLILHITSRECYADVFQRNVHFNAMIM